MAEASATDWIKHDGAGIPVDRDVRVQVRFRDGGYEGDTPASFWADGGDVFDCWKHVNSQSDIIAYRVVQA